MLASLPLPGLPLPGLLDAPDWRCGLCLRPMIAFLNQRGTVMCRQCREVDSKEYGSTLTSLNSKLRYVGALRRGCGLVKRWRCSD